MPGARPQVTRTSDLACGSWFAWIWGLPGALVILTDAGWRGHWLSPVIAGSLLAALTAWIGIWCYVNGRRCRRTHCVIDGVLLPALSIAGVLNAAGVTSFSWQTYLNIFWLVIALSFVPECFGAKYLRRPRGRRPFR